MIWWVEVFWFWTLILCHFGHSSYFWQDSCHFLSCGIWYAVNDSLCCIVVRFFHQWFEIICILLHSPVFRKTSKLKGLSLPFPDKISHVLHNISMKFFFWNSELNILHSYFHFIIHWIFPSIWNRLFFPSLTQTGTECYLVLYPPATENNDRNKKR